MRGQLQLLAGLQIEPVDQPGDGGRRRRMQCFRERPQRFLAMGGLDQDHAGGIEAVGIETVSADAAMTALLVSRQDEDQGTGA
jgi:hypothetical protein